MQPEQIESLLASFDPPQHAAASGAPDIKEDKNLIGNLSSKFWHKQRL